ncbi:MAG: amidohydrolase family protein [Woeseiaceae bacterium]
MKPVDAVFLLLTMTIASASPVAAQVTITQGTNFSVDAAADGRLAIDLLGNIWVVPPNGGLAEAIPTGELPVRRARWSPNTDSIIYQVTSNAHDQIRQYRFAENDNRDITDATFTAQHPSWHPAGERILFSSDQHESGFDLWELDLATQLKWRISHRDGDELEPAWSANGRDLVYVHHNDGEWTIVLRRLGEPDVALVSSPTKLSSPQWRPDGTLLTFLRHGENALSLDMLILSDPLLVRPLISNEDLFDAPVAWLNRQQLVYTANGVIRKRNFNSWSSSNVPFRATVSGAGGNVVTTPRQRELENFDTPPGKLILRTARLFDGIGGGYQQNLDIVMRDGKIIALETRRDRPGEIVVDLGNVTALPGFVDSYANLPANPDNAVGALMLSFGVTMIVAEHASSETLSQSWSSKQTPGPRILTADSVATAKPNQVEPWLLTISGDLATGIERRDAVATWMQKGVPVLATSWQVALGSGASMLLGADALPTSPSGHRYADIELSNGGNTVTVISGLADANTPGLDRLLRSRQADLLPAIGSLRRFSDKHDLAANATSIVLASEPNGLPPGLATHAEFLALKAAGLNNEQVLRSAGVNAARVLGLGLQVGRLAPGSVADIVIVDGDPLHNIADLAKVVGVIRNGRFFSAIGLIERAQDLSGVE